MKLIIAEKKDQAVRLASPFRQKTQGTGYIEVLPNDHFPKGAYFAWASGHLVSLQDPEDYYENWKSWNLETLPMLPEAFKLKPTKEKAAAFKNLQKLLKNPSFTEVINACDPGREGEAIFTYIYLLSGSKKPTKRLWTSSLTSDAVVKAFSNLLAGEAKKSLYHEAFARACADWLIGMNTSRAYTLLLQKSQIDKSQKFNFSTGRVQTPLLSLIVEREQAIDQFVSTPYWDLYADFNINGKEYRGKWFAGETDRILEKNKAEALATWCLNKPAVIKDMVVEDKSVPAPQLYDLSTLQKKANVLYQLSPAEVTSACQKLYDAGYQSYPRSDSKYVNPSEAEQFPLILDQLSKLLPYQSFFPLPVDSILMNKRYVDSSKIGEHYAIIPTTLVPDLNKLSKEEGLIYDLVVKSLIAAHYDDQKVQHTSILTYIKQDNVEFSFMTRGKIILKPGWKKVIQSVDQDNQDTVLPNVVIGEQGSASCTEAKECWTSPPKQYTQGDLIPLMKNAGNTITDKNLKKVMKKNNGLGTEATRASIIQRLTNQEYIIVKKNLVYPTPKALTLIKAIGHASPLTSAETTAKWEEYLSGIGEGKYTYTSFIDRAKELTQKLVYDATQRIGQLEPSELQVIDKKQSTTNQPVKVPKPQSSVSKLTSSAKTTKSEEVKPSIPNSQTNASTEKQIQKTVPVAIQVNTPKAISAIVASTVATTPRVRSISTTGTAESLGACKKCGHPVVDRGNFFGCVQLEDNLCDFRISKKIKGVVIEAETITDLLVKGKSKLIEGFLNAPSGTFNAFLTFNDSGKLSFQSPPKLEALFPLNLLEESKHKNILTSDQREIINMIEKESLNLKLGCKVVRAVFGPKVIRYEIEPDEGLNISSFRRYKDNFQLALQAKQITVYTPIPGERYVGIEIPNPNPYVVSLNTLLNTKEFLTSLLKLFIPIGMDQMGNVIYGNIAKMPHLLVAGATDSGKSVGLNTIVISLLARCSPSELKIIFIDPKQVEFSQYANLPHLYRPIIKDAKEGIDALDKLVNEMNMRYKLLDQAKVKNIDSYNEKRLINPSLPPMPYIVVFIDELRDLMENSASKVESSIASLASMARAAGIHLIIATQRPSKEVVSPIIKANLPVRIAFSVASIHDSRVILGEGGAEELLGSGDMFYAPKSGPKIRAVSAYVSDQEIENIVTYLCDRYRE